MLTNTLEFLNAKRDGRKISIATCYDYTFARLLSETPVDAILVGDSAAMVIHGHPSTLYATAEMMRVHTEAVTRGAPEKFVIADMPFLTFRKGVPAALDTAQLLMTAGAQAVKLEGIDGHDGVIERLVTSGVPVMGHLGLQPQSVHSYGGYRVQGEPRNRRAKFCARRSGSKRWVSSRLCSNAFRRRWHARSRRHCAFRASASARVRHATGKCWCCRICSG